MILLQLGTEMLDLHMMNICMTIDIQDAQMIFIIMGVKMLEDIQVMLLDQ